MKISTEFSFVFDYKAKVEIVNMHFNTRQYDDITLPAGSYDALRVIIGDGKGKNWWCVRFPPICLLEAEEQETNEVEYKSFVKEMIEKYF